MTTNTSTISTRQRAALATVRGLAQAAAWVISLRREVLTYSLSDDECEAYGQPLGTVEPCIYVVPLGNTAWWRLDAWDDGAGCFHLRALGMDAEVHHRARQGTQVAA